MPRAALPIFVLGLVLGLAAGPARADDPPPLSLGQTVYVPVYSHILYGNLDRSGKPSESLLGAMLSIRNIDPDNGMIVRSVRYFDTHGKPIRDYVAQPRTLAPLATIEFFIEYKDTKGGTGANFLIVWDADKPINPPIVETIHSDLFGSRSVVFTSSGRPLHPK